VDDKANTPSHHGGMNSTTRAISQFTQHVGIELIEHAPGRSRWALDLQPVHTNTHGVVHGGVLFTLADTAMGSALFGALQPGQICATINIKINYFKPVFGGRVVCDSVVLNQGKNVAHLDASLFVDDVLVARANGDFAIFMRKTP
jgi:acyl-CoA thioesterase